MAPKLEFILKGSSSRWSTFDNSKWWIAFVVILCASVGLEWYARACGFMLTSDSIQYLSSAKSFYNEGEFLGNDCTYNPYWPPLFPILLSLFSNPLVFLGWMNFICKLVMAACVLQLANTFLKSDFYKSAFVIISMVSVYMIMISVFVWTELLFMTFLLLNAYFALNLRNRFYFLYLVLTGFLLCIQRNAGLFWICGVSVWLLINQIYQVDEWQSKLKRAAVFFLLSTSGLWAWNIYNTFFIEANFTFYERPFFEGFFKNILLVVGAFSKMFMPFQSVALQLILLVLIVGVVLYAGRLVFKNILFIGVVFYVAGFVVLGKLDGFEMDRYLSVVVPFVSLLVLMTIENISKNGKWWRYGMMVLTLIWISYTLVRTVKNVQFWHERSCLTESRI